MATYLVLNTLIIFAVWGLLRERPRRPSRAWIATFIMILILTLLFDNLFIAFDMFRYAPDKILGLYIWLAPIEDFMYALLAVLLIPALWNKLGVPHVRKS